MSKLSPFRSIYEAPFFDKVIAFVDILNLKYKEPKLYTSEMVSSSGIIHQMCHNMRQLSWSRAHRGEECNLNLNKESFSVLSSGRSVFDLRDKEAFLINCKNQTNWFWALSEAKFYFLMCFMYCNCIKFVSLLLDVSFEKWLTLAVDSVETYLSMIKH